MASVKKLLSLDEGIARELESVAEALHKTQKEVVESALDFYFDYTDTVVADKVTRDIQSGNMKVYDAKDVYEELGIEI
jgi:predicted DNA-binding protein